jgi:polysaccharide biosynthesis transport protein
VAYDKEPNLNDVVDLVRRGLWLSLVAAALAAGATYFIVRETPPTYEARATLVASAQDPSQRDFGTTLVTAPALDVATYRSAITSRPVLSDAYRAYSGETPTSLDVALLVASVTVRTDEARVSSVVRIHVRADDPQRARALANAVAAAAVRWDEQRATRSLETIIASLEAQIDAIDLELETATEDTLHAGLQRARGDLQLQLSSARALRTAAVGRLEFLEEAELPSGSIAPRPVRSAGLAGLLAVILVYGLLLLRDALDTRVRSVDEMARMTELPVLAEFPRVVSGRRGIPPEAASHLRTAIAFATTDAQTKVILVTSAVMGHGKSTVAIALAESFARLHFRTLLVDADLRRPVIGSEYGLKPTRVLSLRETLKDPEREPEPVRISFGRRIELDVIPSFDAVPEPAELLSERMPALLDHLRPDYDVIVIDSAPVLPVSDTLTIAPSCTGVLVAVSVPAAERRAVLRTVDLLRRIGIRVLGMVATNLAGSRHGRGYQRGFGYGYEDGTVLTPKSVPPSAGAAAASRAEREIRMHPDDSS